MNQAETFEWLRERSNRLEQVEAENTSLREQLAAALRERDELNRCLMRFTAKEGE